jgi:hypothetical protein
VVIELAADARFARDLSAGGVFVPGCTLRLAEECDLVVCGANHRLMLAARVVYVDEQRGAGLELVGFSPELKAELAELEPVVRPSLELVDGPVLDDAVLDDPAYNDDDDDDDSMPGFTEPVPLVELEALDDGLELPILDDELPVGGFRSRELDAAHTDAYPHVAGSAAALADLYADDIDGDGEVHRRDASDTDAFPQVVAEDPASFDVDTYPAAAEPDGDGDGDGDDGEATTDPDAVGARSRRVGSRSTQPLPRNVHERLRGLTLAAQLRMAATGEQHERIMLERLYGKNVWETLLRNPRLTPPEVSRIARYGALPRVLLEVIVGNNAWLQVPEVRRALLTNPRLGTDQVMKVLRLTPKHELKLAAIQTAYPAAVRQAAKMMLRSG